MSDLVPSKNIEDYTVPLKDELDPEWEKFEKKLRKEVFGQERAIQKIIRSIMYIESGMHNMEGPPPPLLFAGPSGVGKTLLAKVAARLWLGVPSPGEPEPIVYIAGENYNERHTGASLIGAPPGYIGHDKTESPLENIGVFDALQLGRVIEYIINKWIEDNLGDETRGELEEGVAKAMLNVVNDELAKRMPFRSVLLVDEMEKMHPNVQKQFLGMLNEGIVRLNDGSEIDFRKTLIIFTSNIGTDKISQLLDDNPIGFHVGTSKEDEEDIDQKIYRTIREEVKKHLDPALYSRVGHEGIVVFHALSSDAYRKIIDKELSAVSKTMLKNNVGGVFLLSATPEFYEFILSKADASTEGARQISRLMNKHVREPLSRYITNNEIYHGDKIILNAEENDEGKRVVVFRRMHRPEAAEMRPLTKADELEELERDIVNKLDNAFRSLRRSRSKEIVVRTEDPSNKNPE